MSNEKSTGGSARGESRLSTGEREDYHDALAEVERLRERLKWWISNAEGIAKERGELFRAGERISEMIALAPTAQVADWPTDDQIMSAVGAWNTAAQPIRDMVASLSSPNGKMSNSDPEKTS